MKSTKSPLNKLTWKNGNLFHNVKKMEADLKKAQVEVEDSPSNKEIDNAEDLFINRIPQNEIEFMFKDITDAEIKEGFLKQILVHFGFQEKIIGWIMTCVTSAKVSMCVNGDRYGYFKSGRDLIQGDPVSPYLFTLVMEVLALIIQRRVNRIHQFKYHWGCKEIKLTQLCFANDLLMLCNGDHKYVEVLKEGLMEFSKVSILVPKMNKSTIFFGSVKDIKKQRILEVIPFTVGHLRMKYLGVPLITKNIGISKCNQLVEKVKQKVND
nr:RNA-directed DNA polymerase, eukaryota, reverse transcriptase zinc-binding domain protein [Tanacetum cinerariifolium]